LRSQSAKLVLVDLAGSERIYGSVKETKTKEESININRSLFNLRKVISALSEGKQSVHVPYRDSKLTCLLKHSLGGEGSCLMIGCILPERAHYEDNIATLQYANKANHILNAIRKNGDPMFDQIAKLKQRVQELEVELQRANRQLEIVGSVLPRDETSPTLDEGQHNGSLLDRIYRKLETIEVETSSNQTIADNRVGGSVTERVWHLDLWR
jgi:hypothetical protein